MSRGEFTILDSYVGKQDSFVLSNCILNQRIKDISDKNKKLAKTHTIDTRPNLDQIEETHKFYLASIFKPFVSHAYSYVKINPDSGTNSFLYETETANVFKFAIKNNPAPFLQDMVVHVVIDTLVGSTNLKYRYCDFPGMRLFNKFSLKIQGVPLDEYTNDEMIYYYNFNVPSDKRPLWGRCLGQEELKYGEFYNSSFGGITQVFAYKDGPQTPKSTQPVLELWIPLLFWFNLNYNNCLIKAATSSEQMYIELSMNKLSNMIMATDTNGVQIPLTIDKARIKTISLYTRNFFVEPIIQSLFAGKKMITLARVHQLEKQQLITNQDRIKFQAFKNLVEQIQFGFRPLSNNNSFTHWYKFSQIDDREFPEPVIIFNPIPAPINQLAIRTSVIRSTSQVVQNLSLTIHGNVLYKDISSNFFSNYTPFSAEDIIAPIDPGVYLISFNLNNSVQPSGHVNFSQAREIYLEYANSTISANNPTNFIAYAKSLVIIEYLGTNLLIKYII